LSRRRSGRRRRSRKGGRGKHRRPRAPIEPLIITCIRICHRNKLPRDGSAAWHAQRFAARPHSAANRLHHAADNRLHYTADNRSQHTADIRLQIQCAYSTQRITAYRQPLAATVRTREARAMTRPRPPRMSRPWEPAPEPELEPEMEPGPELAELRKAEAWHDQCLLEYWVALRWRQQRRRNPSIDAVPFTLETIRSRAAATAKAQTAPPARRGMVPVMPRHLPRP
jgi:hypothetical protein